MNQYSVKLDAFEGPLDLLLHLINQAEVDIYDIPVAKITDQYLTFIHTMQELELDVASEYLVMAATLLHIKSKMLLPAFQEDLEDDSLYTEEEDDPRQELMNRLIEYRKYKEAAKDLQELEGKRADIHMKPPTDISHYVPTDVAISERLSPISIFDMLGAYKLLLKRKQLEIPLEKTVKAQEYSIEARMSEIMEQVMSRKGKQYFHDLFPIREKRHMVITFLAILELMKVHAIICEQENNFSDIVIIRCEEENRCSFTI